jgi:hypothetical protein
MSKKRFGKPNDGGYVMADYFLPETIAYSCGINEDVSWDLEMAYLGIPIYMFDHTIERLVQSHPLFHWSKVKISPTDDSTICRTVASLLESNGHSQGSSLILKMDIEGDEYDVLLGMDDETLNSFYQIVIEFHDCAHFNDLQFTFKRLAVFERLLKYHQPVHIHANNWSSFLIIGGVPVPNVLEVTYIRRDGHEFSESHEIFPTSLDMPCNPMQAEIRLGNFVY